MERLFSVDDLKKTKLQKKYIRTNKSATAISVGFLVAFLLFTIAFSVYGFGRENSFLVQDVTSSDYGKKNLVLVWFVLITVDIIIMFLWFVQKLVVSGIFGRFIKQRINESLIISSDVIEYGYQNLVGTSSGDRVIVKIPFANISTIRTDQRVKKIEILGMVSSKYYENYSQKKTRAPKNNYKEGSFVLFDYFEPGLIEFLEKNYAEKLEVK